MSKTYDWWEAALIQKGLGEPLPPIANVDEPEPGYYRMSNGPGVDPVPVAYWYDGAGDLKCLVGAKAYDDIPARKAWPYAAKNPVDYDAYRAATAGRGWPDGAPQTSAPRIVPGIGDNASKAQVPEHEVFKDTVDAAIQAAATFTAITSDAQAAQAQSARARCNELAGAAEKKRRALNEPYRALVEAVNLIWKPLGERPKAAADRLAGLMGAWEDKKAAMAKAAAAAARKLAEDALAGPSGLPPAPPPPAPVAPTPPPATQVRGASGRAAGVRVKQVIQSYDLDKLYAHYKARPDVVEFLVRIAQKDVDNGHTIPGVVTEEKRKVT